MNRSAPMKRSAMPPQRVPMRRTALSRRPTRRAATYEAELALRRPVVLSQPCHLCGGHSQVPHHRKLRSQGGDNAWANLLPLCWPCHDLVHANPALSHAAGLIDTRGEDPARVEVKKLASLPVRERLRLTRPIFDWRAYERDRVAEKAAKGPEWGTL